MNSSLYLSEEIDTSYTVNMKVRPKIVNKTNTTSFCL